MQSMTGFGRAETQAAGNWFTVEAKSVNHRYLDARFRLPPALSLYEIPLGEVLRARFERGSFEITVKQKISAEGSVPATRFLVDEVAAQSLAEGCAKLHRRIKTKRVPTLAMLAATNRVFIPVEDTVDPKELFQAVKPAVDDALKALETMRKGEGARLEKILTDGIGELARVAEALSALAPGQRSGIETKLKQRLQSWDATKDTAANGAGFQQRLEWEVAFYAERADITEEIDRLRAHAREFGETLRSAKPIGRKLDFLTQELHREVNTVASKAAMIDVTRLAVEGKTVIEKLREQVQNVE